MIIGLTLIVSIPFLIVMIVMRVRRVAAKHDLLGQAAILSLTSSLDEWKRQNRSHYISPVGEVSRQTPPGDWTPDYYFDGRELSALNGKRIFKILDQQEEDRKAAETRAYGQGVLDKAIKQAQGKLKKVRDNERRIESA